MEPTVKNYFRDVVASSPLAREFICGGNAGAVGIFIGVPFDLVKVRLQTNSHLYRNSWHCFTDTIRNEGLRGIYKGTMAPIMSQGAISSLLFAGEYSAMKILEPDLRPGELASRTNAFLAGAIGGLLQCVALVPADTIKCSMQVDNIMGSVDTKSSNTGARPVPKYSGMTDCATKLYRQGGISRLYRGFWATVIREVPSIGVYFSVYRIAKNEMTPSGEQTSTTATLIAGGLAGCASWMTIYPFDVIKSNIQIGIPPIDASTCSGTYEPPKGIFATGNELVRRHGWKVFTKGLGATMCRAFPVNAATFLVYEYLKDELLPSSSSD